MNIVDGDQTVNGALTVTGAITGNIARTNLVTETATPFPLPIADWRVWDAFATALPGTPAADDLAVTAGAFGTGTPYIRASDVDNSTATQYARIAVMIPHTYVATGLAALRFSAGMLTAIASSAATLDVEAYLFAEDTLKSGSDLVNTAAQSINSLTFADYTFNLVATTLTPGAWLDIRIVITATDVGVSAATIPAISNAELLLQVKG